MCTHLGRQNTSQLLMFKRFGVPLLRLVLEDPQRMLLLKTKGCYPSDGVRIKNWQKGKAETLTNGRKAKVKPHTGTPQEHVVRVKTADQRQSGGNRRSARAPLERKSLWKHNYLQGICWSPDMYRTSGAAATQPAVRFNLSSEVKKKESAAHPLWILGGSWQRTALLPHWVTATEANTVQAQPMQKNQGTISVSIKWQAICFSLVSMSAFVFPFILKFSCSLGFSGFLIPVPFFLPCHFHLCLRPDCSQLWSSALLCSCVWSHLVSSRLCRVSPLLFFLICLICFVSVVCMFAQICNSVLFPFSSSLPFLIYYLK